MTGDPPVRPPAGPPPAGPTAPETASPASATAPLAPAAAPPAPAAPAAVTPLATDGASPAAQNPSAAGPPILDQVFDADSLYALRAAVAAHASAAGLSPARADDLVIAVHELAANAVRHGAGHGRLRVWRAGQALLCEISDDGAEELTSAAQWPTEPGHGLSLVRQVADETSLVSGQDGTLATILFTIGSGPAPFRLEHQHLDRCTVVAVTGLLGLDSASQLTESIDALLTQIPDVALVLDLAGLTGWDSVGLAALVTAQQRISASPPAQLILAGLPEPLRRNLAESGLAAGFQTAATAAAARSMLG